MAIIKDATIEAIKDQIIAKNNILRNFVEHYTQNPWDIIQMKVKSGLAATEYPIGTEFHCSYTQGTHIYDFVWIVVDNDRTVVWEDGTTHPAIILQAKYAPSYSPMFDAVENEEATELTAQEGVNYIGATGNTFTVLNLETGDTIPYSSYDKVMRNSVNDSSVQMYKQGYNRYKMSAIRQWINSEAQNGEWWESQHIGDVSPVITNDGFVAGLDADFVSVITPVKVDSIGNNPTDSGVVDSIYDRFWIPSVEEMYGVPGNDQKGYEGVYFPYWKTEMDVNNPTTNANEARCIKTVNDPEGSAVEVWLRTPKNSNTYQNWFITTTGGMNVNPAYYGKSVLPCCAIS